MLFIDCLRCGRPCLGKRCFKYFLNISLINQHLNLKLLFYAHFQLEIFNELARIFSEDNNAWAQREVLMREGTAKFADTTGENDRHLQKVFQKQVSTE